MMAPGAVVMAAVRRRGRTIARGRCGGDGRPWWTAGRCGLRASRGHRGGMNLVQLGAVSQWEGSEVDAEVGGEI
jgi:hypothetical protein